MERSMHLLWHMALLVFHWLYYPGKNLFLERKRYSADGSILESLSKRGEIISDSYLIKRSVKNSSEIIFPCSNEHFNISSLLFHMTNAFLTEGCLWGPQNYTNTNCHRNRRMLVRRKAAWSGPGLSWQTPGMRRAGDPGDLNVSFAPRVHWKYPHFWDLWGEALKVPAPGRRTANKSGMKGHSHLKFFYWNGIYIHYKSPS